MGTMKNVTIDELLLKIDALKQTARESKKTVINNAYFLNGIEGNLDKNTRFDMVESDTSLAFIKKDDLLDRVYFVTYDTDDMRDLLIQMPQNSVIDYIKQGENDLNHLFEASGYENKKTYVRNSLNIIQEGKEYKSAYSDLLDEYYDERYVEYAKEEDCDAVWTFLYDKFSVEYDHLPDKETVLEWIKNKWVLFYRLNSEIMAMYIYQILGKKLYSACSYNSVSADVLYTLEKKGFIDAMDKHDIVLKYSWIALDNKKALKRTSLKSDNVFDYIYIKN